MLTFCHSICVLNITLSPFTQSCTHPPTHTHHAHVYVHPCYSLSDLNTDDWHAGMQDTVHTTDPRNQESTLAKMLGPPLYSCPNYVRTRGGVVKGGAFYPAPALLTPAMIKQKSLPKGWDKDGSCVAYCMNWQPTGASSCPTACSTLC